MDIVILGNPIPKYRARVSTHGGKTWGYPPERSRAYADLVKITVKNQWQHGLIKKIDKPTRVKLILRFFLKTKPEYRPDLINLIAQIADCLKGFCYDDDSQVTEIIGYKFQDKIDPRVEITIMPCK